jgi:hypothetical protein
MSVSCDCCALSGRGLCDELITFPKESYRLWCVGVCNRETSGMRRPWPSATGRERNARIAQTIDYAVRRTKYHYRDLEYAVSRSDPKFSDMNHSTLVLPFSCYRSVGIVTKLRARRPSIDVQFPEGKKFFSPQNVKTRTHSSSYSAGAGGHFFGVNMAGRHLSIASI